MYILNLILNDKPTNKLRSDLLTGFNKVIVYHND